MKIEINSRWKYIYHFDFRRKLDEYNRKTSFWDKMFSSIEKFNGKLAIIKTSPLILVKSAPVI